MEDKHKCFLVLGGIVFVVSLILILCSLDRVKPINYGLKCNSITKKCNMDKIFSGGLYFVGINYYFIEFPAYQRNIEYSYNKKKAIAPPIVGRTQGGFAVTLTLCFQYRLLQNGIGHLYRQNAEKYESMFDRVARDVIMQAAGKYNAAQYWTSRKSIVDEMQKELTHEFQKLNTVTEDLQILKIDLPKQYEEKIVETQVEVQLQKQKGFERQATLVRKETDILISQTDKQIQGISSKADADSYFIKQSAVSQAQQVVINAESEVTQRMKKDFAFQKGELSRYLSYLSLMNRKGTTLVVGMNGNLIINK